MILCSKENLHVLPKQQQTNKIVFVGSIRIRNIVRKIQNLHKSTNYVNSTCLNFTWDSYAKSVRTKTAQFPI